VAAQRGARLLAEVGERARERGVVDEAGAAHRDPRAVPARPPNCRVADDGAD
jgi:hypothetical protein